MKAEGSLLKGMLLDEISSKYFSFSPLAVAQSSRFFLKLTPMRLEKQ
ncbi:hypothetical protein LLB_0450 [Legionella longbeachae D-4968]|nr:hypothetical protein LLB_0450 [Legionella longbeachae D-4968]